MPQTIFENPVSAPGYCAAFAGHNVALPLKPSDADLGTLLDAHGRDVLTIDVNSERSEDEVVALTAYLCMAINQAAGFKALRATAGDAAQ